MLVWATELRWQYGRGWFARVIRIYPVLWRLVLEGNVGGIWLSGYSQVGTSLVVLL